jgi:hypothetical protein
MDFDFNWSMQINFSFIPTSLSGNVFHNSSSRMRIYKMTNLQICAIEIEIWNNF